MKNVIKREQCKLACGLPSVNILSKVSKFKVLLYLKKSGLNKQGKAPIMGRITLNRSNLFACQSKNSMAQFSCKLSCNPKLDPAANCYSVNFSSEEDVRFLKMFDRSGMTSKSAFIKARIFGEPFHVVTFDKSQHEYYAKLSDFHAQFRMVGNNYNQTLKELKSHFSERRTATLVYKLEKYMMQLVHLMSKVTELTDEYRKNKQKSENLEI